MYNNHFQLARFQDKMGMHGYQVAISQHILDVKLFAGELRVVLLHRCFQRREPSRKEYVVVLAVHVHEFLVSLINLAGHYKLQEFDCSFFVPLACFHFHT